MLGGADHNSMQSRQCLPASGVWSVQFHLTSPTSTRSPEVETSRGTLCRLPAWRGGVATPDVARRTSGDLPSG